MNEILFSNLGMFMMALILVESIVYFGSLWFISYLSRKDKDDSTNS